MARCFALLARANETGCDAYRGNSKLYPVGEVYSQPTFSLLCPPTCAPQPHPHPTGQTPNTSATLQHALVRSANLVMNIGDLTYAGTAAGTGTVNCPGHPCSTVAQQLH